MVSEAILCIKNGKELFERTQAINIVLWLTIQQRQLKKVSSTPTKSKERSPAISSSPSKGKLTPQKEKKVK
ncbi:hypothetical protein M5D96_010437 [Drosophila gunungcola]|uniref:Uncharacterized protein n=1 Tax=Drosophila gunungcola TaxID=103775 RepID=A0A9Q0BLV2_9MUSC|nr:hypothetical protein M5D96_010437 [Drosophila gunungcola]